ncbi:MAG: polysaccharide biosynthesis/export family protein [Sphingomonadaceae bacterium]
MMDRIAMARMPGGSTLLLYILAVFLLLGGAAAVAQTSTPESADAGGYVLGPSDVINVMVYGQSEFNVQTRIKPDGSIVMPLIGRVEAAGRNTIQLADDIRKRLVSGNYLRDPIVNIEVTGYNSRFARVVGHVGASTIVPLDRNYPVLDVLLKAGWVRASASRYVQLHRASDGQKIQLDTDELARAGEGSDIIVQPGDTLFVEAAEVVYLTGPAMRPGAYQLKPGMTIANLLAQAGGVAQTASRSKFGVTRGTADEEIVDDQFVLEKDDVVRVRERLF